MRLKPLPFAAITVAAALAGCATPDTSRDRDAPISATEGRARVGRLLPPALADRDGWATDIHAAMAALNVPPRAANICAVVAVTEQESGFKVDPAVPNLAAIAWKEIEAQRERAGIPRLVLQAALALPSNEGPSYSDRIDAARTERQLSDVFEDFIDRVPLGKTFLAERNPVRTAGPMQVGIAFARRHAAARPYPYPVAGSLRGEVFSRRGGMYFGIAHLLDYPAAYDDPIYRFADFNAGHYASRNAAFQKAVGEVSGIPLAFDGDLLRYEKGSAAKEPGSTELALRTLAPRLDMDAAAIRRDLEREKERDFERTRLYARLFALAERVEGRGVPRAILPRIDLRSAKFTRKLTTEWFAKRVADRYRACLRRSEAAPSRG
jgi:hypothetical protein